MKRRLAPLLALAVVLASCSDSNLLRPADDGGPLASSPALDLVDAANGGGVPGFYFLPPLAKNSTTEGEFDPDLNPSMEVCELIGDAAAVLSGTATCSSTVVKTFPAGSASVSDGSYSFSWNTEKVGEMDSDKFYRLQVLLEGRRLGYLDVNPQNPSGQTPGDDYPGLYAFRLGENLPVKFFLTHSSLCEFGGYVLQCTASAVFDASGGVVSLEPEQAGWPKLSVVLPPDALPVGTETVRVTIERIDPVLFAATTGEECIPMFDAPQFSDCLRVTTDPLLTASLEYDANIEMCIDPFALGLPLGQEENLQIIRYNDDGPDPLWQGLPTAEATTCGTAPAPSSSVLGFLPVPKDPGVMRLAALGVNKVARFLAPEPLAAFVGIRLAGTTSNFSRFRWALPGEMVKTAGDGLVLQASDDKNVTAAVQVLDAVGSPVDGATVHFSNGDDVVTDATGAASTTWTVPNVAGNQELTATALGILDVTLPNNETLIDFEEATVTFTATVVGAPASLVIGGTTPDDGAIVASAWPEIGATVADANSVVVADPNIVWSQTSPGCTGTEAACGSVVDNGDGTVTWTLGQTVGTNTLTGTIAGSDPSVTQTITVTTAPAPADHVDIDALTGAVVGQTYAMTATVYDQYDNARGDALTWTVAAPTSAAVAGADWTLGTVAGETNTVTATVDGTDPAVAASYSVTPVAGAPDKVVAVSGDGQTGPINEALADPLVVSVTDQYGNVTPNQAVSWTATSGSSVTASAPYAWTLGATPNATYTATASVSGGSQSASFTATSRCVVDVDGTMAPGEWVCAQMQTFTASVSGGDTPAEVYWQNDGTNLYMLVRIQESSLDKSNSLRVDFDNDGLGIHDEGDDAIGYDYGAGSFFDEYLTRKCASNGQSGCGATDNGSVDGEGAVGNDGSWTVYELSHPLQGTSGEDFVRTAGDDLGFFLTLRIGKGAQGNTQWPGFRVFQTISIW